MNNKKPREERLTLAESRDKQFDKFRRNLRVLRASVDNLSRPTDSRHSLKRWRLFLNLKINKNE